MSLQPADNAGPTDTRSGLMDQGIGRPILLLHGGGGSATVSALATALAVGHRVLTPTYPGFDGTPRPPRLASIKSLAEFHVELLTALGLEDVLVVGSSMGGWIGCEIALRASTRVAGTGARRCGRGIAVPGEVIADVFSLSPSELMQLSFHDPAAFQRTMPAPTPEQQVARSRNMDALRVYTDGGRMEDPMLKQRLAGIAAPTLVVWGGSDGVVRPSYGQAFAEAIPSARFEIVEGGGHLPHIEQPAAVHCADQRLRRGSGGTRGLALDPPDHGEPLAGQSGRRTLVAEMGALATEPRSS